MLQILFIFGTETREILKVQRLNFQKVRKNPGIVKGVKGVEGVKGFPQLWAAYAYIRGKPFNTFNTLTFPGFYALFEKSTFEPLTFPGFWY